MRWRSLPVLDTPRRRVFGALLAGAVFLVLYGLTNRFPIFPPRRLALGPFDALPLVPIFLLPYLSAYLAPTVIFAFLRSPAGIHRFFYGFLGLTISGCLVFLFLPTSYPRESFPLPDRLDVLSRAAWDLVRLVDGPGNCFPSLHVGTAFLGAFAAGREFPRLRLPLLAWAVLVGFSTLATKQHYFVDVLGGVLLALFWDVFTRRFLPAHAPK